MAGLEIDATFRAGQEAAPVDDNGDELLIGVVVERVPADTSRSEAELIRFRIEATNASVDAKCRSSVSVPRNPFAQLTPPAGTR